MLYEIIPPDAFLRPFIDDYMTLWSVHAVVRNAYAMSFEDRQTATAEALAALVAEIEKNGRQPSRHCSHCCRRASAHEPLARQGRV